MDTVKQDVPQRDFGALATSLSETLHRAAVEIVDLRNAAIGHVELLRTENAKLVAEVKRLVEEINRNASQAKMDDGK